MDNQEDKPPDKKLRIGEIAKIYEVDNQTINKWCKKKIYMDR